MIAGVVLDVDDTLYLERDYVHSGFRAVGEWCQAELDVAGVADRAWELFLVGRRGSTLTDALVDQGVQVDDALRRRVIEIYRGHSPAIALLPDAEEFLKRFGLSRLGVLTDGAASSQRAKCHALGLTSIAEPLVITAEHGTSKPDRAVYRIFEHEWRLPGGQLMYVADNPLKDFIAPVELGWQCIRVRRPDSLHAAIATPEGVTEIASLGALHLDT